MSDQSDAPPPLRQDGEWRDPAADRLRTADALLVLCDFDGTLADITAEPDEASIRPDARAALSRLADAEAVTAGVVSGRALADVRSRVELGDVAYAGNHGLEIAAGERRFVHPAAEEAADELERASERVRDRLAGFDGTMVEEKGLTATVHYRQVDDDDLVEQIRETVRSTADEISDTLRVSQGKQILELRPDVDWDKGRAVDWLRDTLDVDPARTHPLYVGDDVTDEAAFRALDDGTAVAVGSPAETADTGADYRLDDPAAVTRFLGWLAGVRRGE